ncbi:hypothetical protein KIN20_009056 [Parelaphostrongylus tenuis]|uniref:Uncharacterized protein n=1 Tax=Parelaphostrongylus tenuis TaxID=148309 RepID=A0AAD5MQ22_PARTN|nr:hypothetical protein KIN20_009056 [Parelaphostrongylus tenuis]
MRSQLGSNQLLGARDNSLTTQTWSKDNGCIIHNPKAKQLRSHFTSPIPNATWKHGISLMVTRHEEGSRLQQFAEDVEKTDTFQRDSYLVGKYHRATEDDLLYG